MRQDPPQDLQCDVCIVGAGPAGLTLAHALVQRGRVVVLIESGTDLPESPDASLNIATQTGDPLPPMHQARARAVGGTAAVWSTVRRGIVGGKYIPLDPIDLVTRDITPWSGWPLTRTDLDPWYAAAHHMAGLIPFASLEPTDGQAVLPFGADSLSTSNYHWGPADLFTRQLPAALDDASRATLLRNSTATALRSSDSGRQVAAVEWASPRHGTSGSVRATHVVLAAGAVENARLLLLHYRNGNRAAPYWLGRGFMEHPIDRSLTLISSHQALSPDAGFYAFAGRGARANLVGRIGLTEELMRSGELRNASLRLFPVRHRFLSRQLRRLSHRLGRPPATAYRVLLDLEQAPHPDNRVTLSDQHDALRMPMAHLHWQWRPDDESFRLALLQVIQREFARHQCGDVQLADGVALEYGVHHHAGTTRMHRELAHGVVDPTLRVHEHDNLFVAGASVFPTSGVANPTLTVVALSLRLADHLTRG